MFIQNEIYLQSSICENAGLNGEEIPSWAMQKPSLILLYQNGLQERYDDLKAIEFFENDNVLDKIQAVEMLLSRFDGKKHKVEKPKLIPTGGVEEESYLNYLFG